MGLIPGNTLRIIDANLNRIGEGLRFLEEIARMVLNDAGLSQQLKNIRHEMVRGDREMQQRLLQSRDSEGDVGVSMKVPGEAKQREIPEAITANARRVQESLRVMEEVAKVPGMDLDSEKYQWARFELYTLEKILLSRYLRQDKIQRLHGLYVIIDTAALEGRSHIEAAAQAIRGGAKIIQLRDKEYNKKELISVARDLRDLCAEQKALFIMNDYLDVTLAVDADGLHVGQDDLPVKVARRLLPIDKILGCSARTVEEAVSAQADGADYIGVGAMSPTSSKDMAEVVGTARLGEIKQVVNLPLVAIGGIGKENIKQVMEAGAAAAAVISAVLGKEDIEQASRRLNNIIESEAIE